MLVAVAYIMGDREGLFPKNVDWGTARPSRLKIPDGPKMACAALSRRAIDGPCAGLLF